jgi:hypothetical protein
MICVARGGLPLGRVGCRVAWRGVAVAGSRFMDESESESERRLRPPCMGMDDGAGPRGRGWRTSS